MPDCVNDDDETNCCFECSWNGSTKYIGLEQVCDGAQDCDGGYDECLPRCISSSFSDNQTLIKQKPVLAFLFLIGSTAVGGNLFLIVCVFKKFLRPKKNTSRLGDEDRRRRQKINRILLFSLSCSDLLVKIYVLSICVVSALTDGKYCEADRDWRSGTTCSVLGALLLIGSEQFVQTLVMITISRWHAVARPFGEAPLGKVMVGIGFAWIISITMATIPLLPTLADNFVTSIWYPNNKLFGNIAQTEVKNVNMWLMTMEMDSNEKYHGSIESWSTLEYFIGKLNPNMAVGRKYGFYSSHTVCIPDLFPDRENVASWRYSLIIIAINFAAFMAILLFSILIYKQANKTAAVKDKKRRSKQASRMQKKLTAIVLTDFFCWIPVCIMGFLQLSETFITNDWRLVVGLLIIPINSGVNPIIYSNLPERVSAKTAPLRSWIRSTCSACSTRILRGCRGNEDEEDQFHDARGRTKTGERDFLPLPTISPVREYSEQVESYIATNL